jgi:hypothetical protein
VRKISPPPGFDPRTIQPVASRYTNCAIPARVCALCRYIHDITVVQKMYGIENFKQFSDKAAEKSHYFKWPVTSHREVACVIHQAHSSCLPETLRCLGRHCGLHWSTACFYIVHTENTVPTTKYRRKFLFLTPLPNRTTIYNYVKRFRATGSISGNITRGGYVLGKNCARQIGGVQEEETPLIRQAGVCIVCSQIHTSRENITVRRLYDTGSEARLTSDLCEVVFSWVTLQRNKLHTLL